MPTHSIGRSQRSRCAGFMSGSIDRTASVQSSNMSPARPQGRTLKNHHGIRSLHVAFPPLSTATGKRKPPPSAARETLFSPPRPLRSSAVVLRSLWVRSRAWRSVLRSNPPPRQTRGERVSISALHRAQVAFAESSEDLEDQSRIIFSSRRARAHAASVSRGDLVY